MRGGRGAGKTRTGAETLAGWITEFPPDDEHGGEWAVIAPTAHDVKSNCIESKTSGLIAALGGLGAGVKNWNRSEGVLYCANGATVYVDGADDGALRIQGRNLRGVWADEVGLWRMWDKAWHESIRMALRMDPGLIVATGTPKIAHPLIAYLLKSPSVAHTAMRTVDNRDNLAAAAVDALLAEYSGTTLGRQELEGEFIEALEGGLLSRHHWRWFDCRDHPVSATVAGRLPRFDSIVHSWDTAVKGKTSNDPVAGQSWGIVGPDRYLLRVFHGRATFDATIVAMREQLAWGREVWPNTRHEVLIETAANGADAISQMRREVDGVHGYNPRDGGDKVRRALAASPALETGHCWLPGFGDPDPNGLGYHAGDTPGAVQAFVEECALFGSDQGVHDDQVDAWSQMVNWTRRHAAGRASMGRPTGQMPRPGSLQVRESYGR